jgi:hypothetical protein
MLSLPSVATERVAVATSVWRFDTLLRVTFLSCTGSHPYHRHSPPSLSLRIYLKSTETPLEEGIPSTPAATMDKRSAHSWLLLEDASWVFDAIVSFSYLTKEGFGA